MYINLELLKSRNLSLLDIQIIQLSKQARTEDVSDVLSQYLPIVEDLVEKGYLELIKGKKGENELQRIRSTKLGNEILDLISTPVVQDVDIQMYNYLTSLYLEEDATRTLGSRKAGLRYCAEFRQIMGFTPHEMYWLCYMFVQNTIYTKVLEFIFFEKKHFPYSKFKDNLDSSKLYQFWCDNEHEIREFWTKKIKTEN